MRFFRRAPSDPLPSRAALLKALDTLSCPARTERLARLGHEHRGTAAFDRLLDELEGGSVYERDLALTGAIHAGQSQRLLRFVTSASVRQSTVAARYICQTDIPDEALAGVLPVVSLAVRQELLKHIVKARRSALAERLAGTVGDADAARVLPACSAETVARRLPALAVYPLPWRPLCAHHGALVFAWLTEELRQIPPRLRAVVWQRQSRAVRLLLRTHPSQMLELALEYSADSLLQDVLDASGFLLRRDRERTMQLLQQPAWQASLRLNSLPRGLLRQVGTLADPDLSAVAEIVKESLWSMPPLLKRLAPGRRGPLIDRLFPAVGSRPVWAAPLLEVMTVAWRASEVPRLLARREAVEDPDQRIELLAWLPVSEVRDELVAAAFSSDALIRGQALARLVDCTRRSRQGLTETLTYIGRIKNDQDPVRLLTLQAVSRIPASLFTDEHAPHLVPLVTCVVEARDSSSSTLAALTTLAVTLIVGHATRPDSALFQFALSTLERLAGQAGSISLPPLRGLPHGAEQPLVQALASHIAAAARRDSFGLVVSLAQALGRRAWTVEPLQSLLEPATHSKPDMVAMQAIRLWTAGPATRNARVEKLLARDATTITIVWPHLHSRRQDLMDRYDGQPLRGQFLFGTTLWICPAVTGYGRWLPRQQQAHARLLRTIIDDPRRSGWERTLHLKTLIRMPQATIEDALPWLRQADVALAEAALGAIVWLDQPAPALPVLLDNLDTDRARVAMYAVPRLARLIAPGILQQTLVELLARGRLKVTVHKEILRLLGAYRLPRAVDILQATCDTPELHRDVRIAALHAARRLLDRPAVWPLLEQAATSADAFVALSLLDQDAWQLPPLHRNRYASLVVRLAAHPDPRVRRSAFGAFPNWSVGNESLLLDGAAGALTTVEKTPDWKNALRALVAISQDEAGLTHALGTAASLLASGPGVDAADDRDVPARQRLTALAEALAAWPWALRAQHQEALERLSVMMLEDPSMAAASIALGVSSVDLASVPDVRRVLEAVPTAWHEAYLLTRFTAAVQDGSRVSDISSILPTIEVLIRTDLPRAQAVGLHMLVGVAARVGWTEPLRGMLRQCRALDSPVAGLAGAIFTAPE